MITWATVALVVGACILLVLAYLAGWLLGSSVRIDGRVIYRGIGDGTRSSASGVMVRIGSEWVPVQLALGDEVFVTRLEHIHGR